MIFAEEVFGGSVPKNFFPSVEKGLRNAVQKGVLAGYPLVGLKAVLYDGSYHPVDSNDMTQGRGSFSCKFIRYEEAPGNVQQKVIEEAKKEQEA